MSEAIDPVPEKQGRGGGLSRTLRRAGIYLVIALAIFLLGLVPMWLRARARAGELQAAQRELRLSRTQNSAASAVIDARRAEYEAARQSASEFFESLRKQTDEEGAAAALSAAQREGVKPLLAQRDDIITLLARSDPSSVERLTDAYVAYRKVLGDARPQEGSSTPKP
jgi:hypothetical protein